MRLIDWVFRRDGGLESDRNRAAGEVSEILAQIKEAPSSALGMAAVQAADVAARLYADTDGEVDLLSPRAALAAQPALLSGLTEGVIQLQKAGRQIEAVGSIIWVATLRAELFPELQPLVKQMWSLIDRGGFPYVAEAAMLYEDQTGRSLQEDNILFRRVPEGFDE